MNNFLQKIKAKIRNAEMDILSSTVIPHFYSLDAGLIIDDKADQILAAGLWRNFFLEDCEDVQKIEKLVHYIRANVRVNQICKLELIYLYSILFQLKHLETVTNEELMKNFKFLSITDISHF